MKNPYIERIYNGVIKENPVLILLLGMCPTLAVTTSATNGFGMGASTTAVLIVSNLIIAALRKEIPNEVRLPAEIVIVASIPLIVVNCIILGRAEAFALKNGPLVSAFDGLGMGLGFTIALTILGLIREVLGAGTAFGVQVLPASIEPIGIFIKAPGAFLVLTLMIAVMNMLSIKNRANEMVEGCDGCCANCGKSSECTGKEEK